VEIFDRLRAANGGTLSGFFDVFAWRSPARSVFTRRRSDQTGSSRRSSGSWKWRKSLLDKKDIQLPVNIGKLVHVIKIIPDSDVSALGYIPEFRERVRPFCPGPHFAFIGIASPGDPTPITGKLTPVTLNFAFRLNLIRRAPIRARRCRKVTWNAADPAGSRHKAPSASKALTADHVRISCQAAAFLEVQGCG
jgi:hypothetical protein